MRTADGETTVEAITIGGVFGCRVKCRGLLMGGELGRYRGFVKTIDKVKALLGESFGTLAEDWSQRFEGGG